MERMTQMLQKQTQNTNNETERHISKPEHECLTLKVDAIEQKLGIGRSAAYAFVRKAEATGEPFKVFRIGSAILVSAKSFNEYLKTIGL